MNEKKVERLMRTAQLYYLHHKTQGEIAQELGVSRPMVSRLLLEARECGIVHVEIRTPPAVNHFLLDNFRSITPLKGGLVVPNGINNSLTNTAVASAALTFTHKLRARRLGIGWGGISGIMAAQMETAATRGEEAQPASGPPRGTVEFVVPLIGSSGISCRSFHTNALCRALAQQYGAEARTLHSPAFFGSAHDIDAFRGTDHYASVESCWKKIDTALIEMDNYPSLPDFSTQARFRHLLGQNNALGRFIAYYYNQEGQVIYSDTDYTMQIPLDMLARCRNVVGLCSATLHPLALLGALRTKLFTHIIAPESLVRAAIQLMPGLPAQG